MHAIIGGVLIGVGGIWLMMAAWSIYLARSGVDPGNVQMRPSEWADPSKRAWARTRSLGLQQRQAAVMRKGCPVAVVVIIIGVVSAVI
jgi:hypothetical protein